MHRNRIAAALAIVLGLGVTAAPASAAPSNSQCDTWTNTGVLGEWVGYDVSTGTANPTGAHVGACVGTSSNAYGYGADAFTGTSPYLGRWATAGATIDGDTDGRYAVQYAQAASCPIWGPAFVGAVYVSLTGTRACV